MTRSDVLARYRERLRDRAQEARRRERTVSLISYARLAVFAAGVALLWVVLETDLAPATSLIVPAALFLGLLLAHARAGDALRGCRRASDFYRRGVARLEDQWQGKGRTGEGLVSRDHPYARDLDVFGKGSLFELLAVTVSPWGTATLALWLSAPATPETVRRRQQAVEELRPLLDLRERLASEPDEATAGLDSSALARWASAPPVLTSSLGRWVALALGLLTTALTGLWLASIVDRPLLLLCLSVSGSFAILYRTRVRAVLAAVEGPCRDLSVLASLLSILESEGLDSPHLASLSEALVSERTPASKRIQGLARLVELLDARRNQLFAPVAALLLWGTQFAFALEAWRARNGPSVARWLEAVGELDALLALSSYAFESPDDPFPEISDAGGRFEAAGLGHPLIPASRLVRNDVSLGRDPPRFPLLVVSGSNMSGKSTLLRAIGINVVLALAGAPVRATKLALSRLQIGASIRIEDSLQEGISHFYAEILRLRQVMELAKGETALLFLFDEILHGTNSHDRRIGAEAVVRSLVGLGAIGLITTHDLALSRLAETMEHQASNVHFEDQIEDGKIRFDYVMREGVVKKSNALELMRAIGLEV
jgi:MutS domain V